MNAPAFTHGRPRFPLWIKLTLAGVLVEAVMLVVLVASNARITEQELSEKAYQRISSTVPLLNAALAGPLMQRDYGALQEILDEARRDDSYTYLLLLDMEGHRVAQTGLHTNAPLPELDQEISTRNHDLVYDTEIAINLSGRIYGHLRFGIPTNFLVQARERVLRQGAFIGVAALALTLVTLALVGYLLTRRLKQLTLASQAIADDNFDALLPAHGRDEVGQLTAAFRQMSEQLKARLSELRQSEQRFFAIAHYTYDLELWIDPSGHTIWVNPSVQRMTGFTPEECLAMPGFPLCLIDPQAQEEAGQRFRRALSGDSGEGYQFRMRRKSGDSFWAAVNWLPIYDREGQSLGIRASIRDISELKDSEERALEYLAGTEAERARLKALLSAMNLGILFVGADGRVIYHNPAFSHIWRMPDHSSLIGLDCDTCFTFSACELSDAAGFRAHLGQVLVHREEADSHEIQMKDGRVVTQLSYAVRDRDNRFLGYLWIYEDVTSERQTAEQMLYLAERDSLTGLYNRHRFQAELERMMAESGRHRAASALLYFDLDENLRHDPAQRDALPPRRRRIRRAHAGGGPPAGGGAGRAHRAFGRADSLPLRRPDPAHLLQPGHCPLPRARRRPGAAGGVRRRRHVPGQAGRQEHLAGLSRRPRHDAGDGQPLPWNTTCSNCITRGSTPSATASWRTWRP